jgi:putative glutamine amidotransferase
MIMEPRVLVGVPGQSLQAMDGIPEGIPESWVMSRRYFTTLARAGAVPVMVPLLHDDEPTLRALYDHLDGLFLAGGVDVDPHVYGHERHELCGRTDAARDAVEVQLARWAMADGKPVLGVCRGLHVINVAMGGSLWQDTSALYPGAIKHDYFPTQGFDRDHLAHNVEVSAGSRLGAALGTGTVPVNSMHHQGIQTLGRQLAVTAVAPDGLIEGIESMGDNFLVAVQWHPEALPDEHSGTLELFTAFTRACAAWRNRVNQRDAALDSQAARRRA